MLHTVGLEDMAAFRDILSVFAIVMEIKCSGYALSVMGCADDDIVYVDYSVSVYVRVG